MKSILPPYLIHERIKVLRYFSGLSQQDLAQQLKVTQSWMSKMEAGRLEVSAEHLLLLRSIFGISSDAILDGVIPYYEIARRKGRTQLLPKTYRDNPTLQMKSTYPFVSGYEKRLSQKQFFELLDSLSISPFLFADPNLPVNISLLLDFIQYGIQLRMFDDPGFFSELSQHALKLLNPEEIALLKEGCTPKGYVYRFISVAQKWSGHELKLQPAGRSTVEMRLLHLTEQDPILSGVYSQYYLGLFKSILSVNTERTYAVHLLPENNHQEDSVGRIVRYHVSWT